MQGYEYKAVPAPLRAEKNRALKTSAERFAATVSATLNEMAGDGWEYVRADVLPCEERSGFTGKATQYHNLLIFRRALGVSTQSQIPADTPPAAPLSPLSATAPAVNEGAAPRLHARSDSGQAPRLGPASGEPSPES
jgi:hypothetical protein